MGTFDFFDLRTFLIIGYVINFCVYLPLQVFKLKTYDPEARSNITEFLQELACFCITLVPYLWIAVFIFAIYAAANIAGFSQRLAKESTFRKFKKFED